MIQGNGFSCRSFSSSLVVDMAEDKYRAVVISLQYICQRRHQDLKVLQAPDINPLECPTFPIHAGERVKRVLLKL